MSAASICKPSDLSDANLAAAITDITTRFNRARRAAKLHDERVTEERKVFKGGGGIPPRPVGELNPVRDNYHLELVALHTERLRRQLEEAIARIGMDLSPATLAAINVNLVSETPPAHWPEGTKAIKQAKADPEFRAQRESEGAA